MPCLTGANGKAIPPKHATMVTELMLAEFEVSLGVAPGAISCMVVESKAQLWGAGVPMTVMKTGGGDQHGYIWDADRNVGVCGDWLSAPSIEGAAMSGTLLAEAIARAGAESVNLSMKPVFTAVPAADVIGSFAPLPGVREAHQVDGRKGGTGKGQRGRKGRGAGDELSPAPCSPDNVGRKRRQGKGRVQGSWGKEANAGGDGAPERQDPRGKSGRRAKGTARGKGKGGQH